MLWAFKHANVHALSYDIGVAVGMVIHFVIGLASNFKWWSPQCLSKVKCLSHGNAHEYGY
jgi:hypothetical protein